MTSLVGNGLLLLAGLIALLQILLVRGAIPVERLHRALAIAQTLVLALAFVWLAAAFVRLDWSLWLVVQDSSADTPWWYRIGAAWGQHEGSLLLWLLVLSGYGLFVALTPGLPRFDAAEPLRRQAVAIVALLLLAFLLFTGMTSSPFVPAPPGITAGLGLTPVLLDPALLLHPPLLYLGYVGLSASFALALAGLMTGSVDRALGAILMRATLLAWTFLTAGLALGSWWAYYELGWGGWWAWDPVENLPLVSWLLATALLHSATVLAKRGLLAGWTVLLAILAFSASLFGTFFVRSGLLTSVHSFASDPTRGLVLLALSGAATLAGLAIYAWRAPQLQPREGFGLLSREAALVMNNALLSAAAAVVLLGTLYPVFQSLVTDLRDGRLDGTGDTAWVAASYFVAALAPLMLPLFALMGLGPFLAWKRGQTRSLPRNLVVALIASLSLVMLLLLAWRQQIPPLALASFLLAAWLGLGAVVDFVQRSGLKARRLFTLPLRAYALLLAHVGLSVALFGMFMSSVGLAERQFLLSESQPEVQFDGERFRLLEQRLSQGPGYEAFTLVLQVSDARGTVEISPSRRLYLAQGMPTSESVIMRRGITDWVVAAGLPRRDGSVELLVRRMPGVVLIWLGAAVMVLGGFFGLGARLLSVRESRA